MVMAQSKHAAVIDRERSLASYLPFSSHLSPTVLMAQDSSLMTVFEVQGINSQTKNDTELNQHVHSLQHFYKGLSDKQGVSLWMHTIRRRESFSIGGEFTLPICQQINDDYQSGFKDKALVNRFYITLVLKNVAVLSNGLFGSKVKLEDEAAKQQRITGMLSEMNRLSDTFLSTFSEYGIRQLGCVDTNVGYSTIDGHDSHSMNQKSAYHFYSEPLCLFHYLLSGRWQPIVVPDGEINRVLPDAQLAVGRETIELKRIDGSTYLQGLEIKEYPNNSQHNTFDALLSLPFEFVLTQSFSLKPREEAMTWLKRHQGRLNNGGDLGTQKFQLSEARSRLADDDFAMGEYHFSFFVFASSQAKARECVVEAEKVLLKGGIRSVPISIALDSAFFAQFPANWSYRPRVVRLTTSNISDFWSFHNVLTGKRDHAPWGDAVTRLKPYVKDGAPYYFNFHQVSPFCDDTGKTLLGNTTVIGKSGTGKSVLLALLIAQMQKFAKDAPLNLVVFDKDRGLEALVRSMGGVYSQIKHGEPTGFNPFALIDMPHNRSFLKRLCRRLLKPSDVQQSLSDKEIEAIDTAVNGVMDLPPRSRRLWSMSTFIQDANLLRRLSRWIGDGEFAWVFDNDVDTFDFQARWIVGVDGTHLLTMGNDLKTPISLYLLHRMDEVIDGRRFAYFMDEAWAWVNDDAFSEFVSNKQVTIRKQNGFGVFATQTPRQLIDSPVGMALTQSCATEIYLANPKATYEEYVTHFKLTPAEFDLLTKFGESSRLCLVKTNESTSVICSFALPKAMKKWLPVLSISSEQLPFLEQALEQGGDNPDDWLPLYLDAVS
jgi:type IV secretion system protein VirB4